MSESLVKFNGGSVQAAIDNQNMIEDAIKKLLKKGIDYAKIPGCGPKPVLLKSGAERLFQVGGVYWKTKVKKTPLPMGNGHVEYTVKTEAYTRDTNMYLGDCVGTANTQEPKFLRDTDKKTGIKGENPGYKTAPTVLKMAEKRSLVGLALLIFSLSNRFTADMDDETKPAQNSGYGAPPETKQENPPATDEEKNKFLKNFDTPEACDEFIQIATTQEGKKRIEGLSGVRTQKQIRYLWAMFNRGKKNDDNRF